MARPAPRHLRVIRTIQISTNMRRITLGGENLASFPPDQEGAYVKMLFAQGDSNETVVRTYTVRFQRTDEIDIDFVIHDDGGPAADWARKTKSGDMISIRGPGPRKLVNNEADWILIVGDMTALPAIGVNIEQLPSDAIGHAVIEVIDETDIQEFSAPENFQIQWLVNPNPGKNPFLLANEVRSIQWRNGKPSVWAACEFNVMRELRDYFRGDHNVHKDDLYISSYWKHGSDEASHRIAKRSDVLL